VTVSNRIVHQQSEWLHFACGQHRSGIGHVVKSAEQFVRNVTDKMSATLSQNQVANPAS
jgi:hypothetical protein